MRMPQPNFRLYQGKPDARFSPYQSEKYALDDQKTSNYTTREAESALLEKVGLSTDVHSLRHVEAVHTMIYAAQLPRTDKEVIFSSQTHEILQEKGYEWRKHPSLQGVTPETALYLDAYVRAREIDTYVMKGYAHHQNEMKWQEELYRELQGACRR